jgi:hypothetical protein
MFRELRIILRPRFWFARELQVGRATKSEIDSFALAPVKQSALQTPSHSGGWQEKLMVPLGRSIMMTRATSLY